MIHEISQGCRFSLYRYSVISVPRALSISHLPPPITVPDLRVGIRCLYRRLRKYRTTHDYSSSYWWAKEASSAYPKDYNYLEWLAFAEYQLAFDENLSENPNSEFFNELIENSLRHYEIIIEDCSDTDIYSKAVLGKIMVLRFLERIEEADWSAEFEYPDINIKTATQALFLFEEGQTLLNYLVNENK